MTQTETRDEALFEAIQTAQKKKKRKVIRTVVTIIVILAAALTAGTIILRHQVAKRFATSAGDVKSAQAERGSISTTVSGYGALANVDEEELDFPYGITVEKISVDANDKVKKGDVLAKISIPSVMKSIAALQKDLNKLDNDINTASFETIKNYIATGTPGRVKKIFAAKGELVSDCMYKNRALMLLSLDGYMAVDIPAGDLKRGEAVTIVRSDEKHTELPGRVDCVIADTATVLVSDDGPLYGEKVLVKSADGIGAGEGELYIHSPLSITGYAGRITGVGVEENRKVAGGTVLIYLDEITYSPTYAALLDEREKKAKTFNTLMQIYADGAYLAPYDGSIVSVSFDKDKDYSKDYKEYDDLPMLTISPDRQMEIQLDVDESNILSLRVGQEAEVTINAIGDEVYSGTVTEINKTATSSSGVTRYKAIITLDKAEEMLVGMTASVVIRIQGKDDAIIIPVDALHQTSSTAYVYTSFDSELQQYGNPVEVTTGISNSNYVEITEGLKEGDTVWYVESQDDFWKQMRNRDRNADNRMPEGEMPGGPGSAPGERPNSGSGTQG